MLLGKIQADGTRKVLLKQANAEDWVTWPHYFQPGCIDKFSKETSTIISFVAGEAETMGLTEDSVRLYDLAKVYWSLLLPHFIPSLTPPHFSLSHSSSLLLTPHHSLTPPHFSSFHITLIHLSLVFVMIITTVPVCCLCPQNHNKAIELLNRLLSGVISVPPTPQSERSRLQALAVGIAERYIRITLHYIYMFISSCQHESC